jgi:hypothetical protein
MLVLANRRAKPRNKPLQKLPSPLSPPLFPFSIFLHRFLTSQYDEAHVDYLWLVDWVSIRVAQEYNAGKSSWQHSLYVPCDSR